MRIADVNNRFERVIQRSLVKPLLMRGYKREDDQFYLKVGRVGKLLVIKRDPDHTHYRQIAIFTIDVYIISDDFWELRHSDQSYPEFPFQGHDYYVLHRHLGHLYGKRRGHQWLALDATVPEQTMSAFLGDLLSIRILPYLDKINSIDDILNELKGPSRLRMEMLTWLRRRDEAYLEFTRLIASRHQKRFRITLVGFARRIGVID